MIEVRFHGRGGQGAVTAAELLAVAAFKDKKYSQAFPAFGPERRGAPVASFCRIDEKPILVRQQVYNPDLVVVLDPSLLKTVDVFAGLRKGGKVLVNADCKPRTETKEKLFSVNATKIAMEAIGKPIVNTAMLGAVLNLLEVVSLASLEEAIRERFKPEVAEKNVAAVKKAHEGVVCHFE